MNKTHLSVLGMGRIWKNGLGEGRCFELELERCRFVEGVRCFRVLVTCDRCVLQYQ